MKKCFSILFAALAAVIMFASCSKADQASEVARKIEAGDTLTQAEYTTVIDYLGDFAQKAQPIQDKINNLPYGDPQATDLQKELSALKEKNGYFDLFKSVLESAPQSSLGADNVALVNKYAGYEWFASPSWATIQTDPEAAGLEVQTPDSDTTGVVAGAVDELKIKSGL